MPTDGTFRFGRKAIRLTLLAAGETIRSMKVLGALLFALAGALLVFGYAAADNLWTDQGDSPDSTYVEAAAIMLALALAAAVGGALAWRHR